MTNTTAFSSDKWNMWNIVKGVPLIGYDGKWSDMMQIRWYLSKRLKQVHGSPLFHCFGLHLWRKELPKDRPVLAVAIQPVHWMYRNKDVHCISFLAFACSGHPTLQPSCPPEPKDGEDIKLADYLVHSFFTILLKRVQLQQCLVCEVQDKNCPARASHSNAAKMTRGIQPLGDPKQAKYINQGNSNRIVWGVQALVNSKWFNNLILQANLTSMQTCPGMLHANPGFIKPLLRYFASKSHRHWVKFINISIHYNEWNHEASSCVNPAHSVFFSPSVAVMQPFDTKPHAQPRAMMQSVKIKRHPSTRFNRSITDLIYLSGIHWALLPLDHFC